MKTNKEILIESLAIFSGTALLNIGFYFFFLPNNLVAGGVSGIAVVLNHYNIPPWLSIFILNIVFLTIGFIVLGKQYGMRSIYASLLSPLIIFIFEVFGLRETLILEQFTESPLLVSTILGSLFTGAGLGVVFRNGGSTGGMDIAQNILHEKAHINYKTAFILTDGIVVLIGLIVFRNFEMFLYAVGSIVLFSLIVDNLSIAGRAGHTLFIVTNKTEKVKTKIHEKLNRGTTIIDVRGGYSKENKTLIICVINKKQLIYARRILSEADPDSFIFIAQTKEAVGLGFTYH